MAFSMANLAGDAVNTLGQGRGGRCAGFQTVVAYSHPVARIQNFQEPV